MRPVWTRREFLSTTSAAVVAAVLRAREEDLWSTAADILRRIKDPVFPARDVNVTAHGAKGDGTSDCTAAFRAAIDACHAAGGGRVVVPAGRFLTGAIRLRSNVNLHLLEGATLAFRTEAEAYLPLVLTRFEGVELMNYSPFVYALDETNVGITGRGTLDGQANAQNWWAMRTTQAEARTKLIRMAADGVAPETRVFGDGPSRLRVNFIQPYRCQNVIIEGVSIVNSPMWEVNPVLCTNVTVRGLNISSHGPNNDGCDPEQTAQSRASRGLRGSLTARRRQLKKTAASGRIRAPRFRAAGRDLQSRPGRRRQAHANPSVPRPSRRPLLLSGSRAKRTASA